MNIESGNVQSEHTTPHKTHWFLILFFVVLLGVAIFTYFLFFSSSSSSSIKTEDIVKSCESYTQLENKGLCYVLSAIYNNDESLCNKIEIDGGREECISSLSNFNDPENCKSYSSREDCLSSAFIFSSSPFPLAICDSFSNESFRLSCTDSHYYGLAKDKSDAKYCDIINNSGDSKRCYEQLAFMLNQTSLCDKTYSPSSCISAIEEKTQGGCLTLDVYPTECIYNSNNVATVTIFRGSGHDNLLNLSFHFSGLHAGDREDIPLDPIGLVESSSKTFSNLAFNFTPTGVSVHPSTDSIGGSALDVGERYCSSDRLLISCSLSI